MRSRFWSSVSGIGISMKSLFQPRQCFGKDLADDGQAFGVDFVECVLGCVPVGDGEVDEIAAGDAAANEGEMVVAGTWKIPIDKRGLISELGGSGPDEICQPRG